MPGQVRGSIQFGVTLHSRITQLGELNRFGQGTVHPLFRIALWNFARAHVRRVDIPSHLENRTFACLQ